MVQGQSVKKYDVARIYKKGHCWSVKVTNYNPIWDNDNKKLADEKYDKALLFCMKMNYQFLLRNNVTIILNLVEHSEQNAIYTHWYFINNKYVGELKTPTVMLQNFHLCKIINTLTKKGLI